MQNPSGLQSASFLTLSFIRRLKDQNLSHLFQKNLIQRKRNIESAAVKIVVFVHDSNSAVTAALPRPLEKEILQKEYGFVHQYNSAKNQGAAQKRIDKITITEITENC